VNQLLTRQVLEVIGDEPRPNALPFERSVRVAAATLSNARQCDVSGTTVIGVLGPDDQDALLDLVEAIAQEYTLDATIKPRGGSFSVHFARDS